jgi:2-amino-4-hydroxy-6-hydroxymethyldihydropteridine diphosphokinase
VRAYVGLGSNLGDREETVHRALGLLNADPHISVLAVSSLRETDPVGYLDQPRFLNGACLIDTSLSPRELLDRLLDVERQLGRTRGGQRFGPRTIDLDLVLYEGVVVDEPGLTVPHPSLLERQFVLEPLADLDPSLLLPDGRTVSDALSKLE